MPSLETCLRLSLVLLPRERCLEPCPQTWHKLETRFGRTPHNPQETEGPTAGDSWSDTCTFAEKCHGPQLFRQKQGCSSSTESQKVKHLEKTALPLLRLLDSISRDKVLPCDRAGALPYHRKSEGTGVLTKSTPRATSFVPLFLFPTRCCVGLATCDQWSMLVKD